MLKLGDKVERIKGKQMASGMNIGDRGTVIASKMVANEEYVKLKEYPNGWHSAKLLEKQTTLKIDWDKIVENTLVSMNKEEDKRNLGRHQNLNKIETLKKQRDKIDKQIQELENKEVKLDDKYIEKIYKKNENKLVDANLYQKGNTITCLLTNPVTDKILGKGISKCCPGDKFDMNIGCEIAFSRAAMSYNNRRVHELIRSTY